MWNYQNDKYDSGRTHPEINKINNVHARYRLDSENIHNYHCQIIDSWGTNTSLCLRSFDSWGTSTSLCLRSFDSWGTNTLVCLRSFDSLGTNKFVFVCLFDSWGTNVLVSLRSVDGWGTNTLVCLHSFDSLGTNNLFFLVPSLVEVRSLRSKKIVFLFVLHVMEPRNRFQGTNSASQCSLAGQYNNPIPTRFLVPKVCLKIPARCWNFRTI